MLNFRLSPLPLSEIKKSNSLPKTPYELIFKGFYPPLHDKNRNFILDDWFENYIDSYLNLDVRDQINVSNVKTPKLYFVDCGLLCHLLRIESKEDLILSPYKGGIAETFAVSELLKSRLNKAKKSDISYFRDSKGFEIDTIANWKKTYAIEIKSTSESEAKLSANTRKYLELKNDENAKGAVFYLGDLTLTLNGIDYVSWKDWNEWIEKNAY